MATLSVCMIVKNEEKNLARVLDCAKKFADEIVIVDTGSLDSTKEIAARYTTKIFDFVWCDDFAKARNYSFSKATSTYMMWLDGDDFLLDEDIEKLKKLKKRRLGADVYMLKYIASYDKNFKPLFSYYRERIVRRDKNFVWVDPVHEVIVPRGKIDYLDICVYHGKIEEKPSSRNIDIYNKLIASGKTLSPRQQFYYARELMNNNLSDDAIAAFCKFLLSKDGWIENRIEALLNLARLYSQKSQFDEALDCLFATFKLGRVRGEVVYEVGNVFLSKVDYKSAIFWYNLALSLRPQIESGGFVENECYDFLPTLQLCLCHYNLGEIDKAKYYHSITRKLRPDDPAVKHNEEFFASLEKSKNNNLTAKKSKKSKKIEKFDKKERY